jgi:hypothetical protein
MGSKFSDIASDIFPASFSEAVLEFDVKDGKAEVTKGRFTSEPVEIEIGGNIQLRKDLERSRIDLEITLKFNEQLDRLARIAPMLSAGRDADGTYHLGATGTVLAPRLREERGGAKRRTPTAGGGIEPENGSPNQEDREKAREERLERLKERASGCASSARATLARTAAGHGRPCSPAWTSACAADARRRRAERHGGGRSSAARARLRGRAARLHPPSPSRSRRPYTEQ